MKIRTLDTASAVIDALGGTVKFGELIGRPKQHVSNYRVTGRLPHDTFLICSAELKRLRLRAPASIWGIKEPSEQIAS